MTQAVHEIVSFEKFFPASIIIRKPGDILLSSHWHEELELTASLDSKINYFSNGVHTIFDTNELVVTNCCDIHKGYPVSGFENYAITMRVDPSVLEMFCDGCSIPTFSVAGRSQAKREILACMQELYEIFSAKPGSCEYIRANSLLYQILYVLFSQCRDEGLGDRRTQSEKYGRRYQEVLTYMNEHYAEPITLDEVAKVAGVSKEHFSRDFKRRVGESFKTHMSNIRLSKAQDDLRLTDLPLTHIAHKHGFADLRSYNTSFERAFGMSPAEYRRSC